MKFVLAGGSGFLGSTLARALTRLGHEVVVLSRRPAAAPWRVVPWDARTAGDWVDELDGADAVVNLAGRSVNCRYGAQERGEILASRVESTSAIGTAIKLVARPPRVWLQSSTATIYAHRYDAANDEASGILGGSEAGLPDTWKFSIEVAKAWEQETARHELPSTRTVALRTAIVMGPDRGGAFDTLLALVRFGLGGRSGDGRQYVSWIHHADFVRAVLWLVDHGEIDGAINLAAPEPLPNSEFMKALRSAWGAPFGLPATRWMLELGAIALRTETELVLKSRRVVPGRLLAGGFSFEHRAWPEAALSLCAEWRAGRAAD